MRTALREIPAAFLTLAALAACHEPTSETTREVVSPPAFDLAGKTCSTGAADPTGDEFNRIRPCGQYLELNFVGFTSSTETGAVVGASENWNEALEAVQLNLPRFGTGTPKTTVTVRRILPDAGAGWCGTASKAAPWEITLRKGPCAGTSGLGAVATQELSHMLGFTDKWDIAVGPDSTLGHCSGRSYPQLTGIICQHELETVYRAYGLRGAVNYSKHIITGLTGLQNRTLPFGGSANLAVTHLRFDRVNGSICGRLDTQTCVGEDADSPVTATNVDLNWSEAAGGQFITLSASGASATVTAGSTPGQATVEVEATSTVYGIAAALGDNGTGTKAIVTVEAVAPAGPPTSLTATNIASTSALVRWTNGDATPGTTTVVQYRMTGQQPWITASGPGVPAGQSSLTISGLHCATSYDVNVFHVKSGISSPWLTLTLFTTSACQVSSGVAGPTAFSERSCSTTTQGGKTFATYTLGWTAGSNPGGSIYQIATSLTNNTANASVLRTGAIIRTSDNVGPYLVTSTASPRYVWVRHANGAQASVWVALAGNPIQIRLGCA